MPCLTWLPQERTLGNLAQSEVITLRSDLFPFSHLPSFVLRKVFLCFFFKEVIYLEI